MLQIENEYYSFIRPKRVARSGERPTKALKRAGVEYVEMRSLDVSALDPVGVNQNKLRFLEAFLAFCAVRESADRPGEQVELDRNHVHGRAPRPRAGPAAALRGRDVDMNDWAGEILDAMQGISELLDHGERRVRMRPRSRCRRASSATSRRRRRRGCSKEMRDTGETFFEHRAAHVAQLQGVLHGAAPAERGAQRRVRRRGRGIARGAGAARGGEAGAVRDYLAKYLAD